MTKGVFLLTAVLYWACFALRIFLWRREHSKLALYANALERCALLAFTAALVLYIGKLEVADGQVHSDQYDRPVSYLLLAWSISAAHLCTEIVYGNKVTAFFADAWSALSLTIFPLGAQVLNYLFTNDLQWLSFHRLCFLLGYAFCILGFPLVTIHLAKTYQVRKLPAGERDRARRELRNIDRMSYRMVLWALPLLTAGMITEGLLLLEANQLPSPAELWTDRRETLLALTAWFLCGIFLHTRLFFGWRNFRSAALYLAGSALLLIGHFSEGLSY
jgi:hypothetical protein